MPPPQYYLEVVQLAMWHPVEEAIGVVLDWMWWFLVGQLWLDQDFLASHYNPRRLSPKQME